MVIKKCFLICDSFILLFVASLSLLTLSSCSCHNHLRVGEVKYDECVPDVLFVDYVEQMKYLAMKDTSTIAKEKRKAIIDIEEMVNEARSLLEIYRKNYCYGNCENQR